MAHPPEHVAAAAIFSKRGEVLLALRPPRLHQGGLWEFPGGKVEPGEEVLSALKRELREELGITVISARPLIRIHHAYPDKAVLLDVWRVNAFEGEPGPREGQRLAWVPVEDLARRDYPAANLPIIKAVQLPSLYLISAEPAAQDTIAFLQTLERCLRAGAGLIQLRAKTLDAGRLSPLGPRGARALPRTFRRPFAQRCACTRTGVGRQRCAFDCYGIDEAQGAPPGTG